MLIRRYISHAGSLEECSKAGHPAIAVEVRTGMVYGTLYSM
jgi:hypothetical protein